MADDDNQNDQKKLWHPKTFLSQTPCVRNALMYGIYGGLIGGAATFAYTKHVRRSCDVAVGSFAVASLASWQYCYYGRMQEKRSVREAIEILEKKNIPRLKDGDIPASASTASDTTNTVETSFIAPKDASERIHEKTDS